jgi:hypothetical protein
MNLLDRIYTKSVQYFESVWSCKQFASAELMGGVLSGQESSLSISHPGLSNMGSASGAGCSAPPDTPGEV